MSDLWPWAALVGLGLFHGINPAMGWLFAVGLGLQEGRRAAVWRALPPIALGHAASILAVALAAGLARAVVAPPALRLTAATILLGFAGYRFIRGYRHRFRAGMRASAGDLALWSFLMATAHGAGLMILPVLLALPIGTMQMAQGHMAQGSAHSAAMARFAESLGLALAAVGVHMAATLLATGAIAIVVFDRVGLAVLRRGWINLDLLWSCALLAAGLFLLAVAVGSG